jgi:Flp pilus assembly secretin CpaC
VAVTPVPSGFVRDTNTDAVASSDSSQPSALVQQAEESPELNAQPSSNGQDPTFANRQSIVDAGIKLTPLYMKSAQVRSLTVAGELQDIQVADSSVCRAVAVGPNQLKLIGTGNGITQLVVWAKTDEPNQPVKMRAFEVHVDRVDPAVAAGGSTSQMLQQSIRDAFPQCQVELMQEGGHLIVRGRCDSPQSAEKIIRMIRKTCNVPVNDQLIVR